MIRFLPLLALIPWPLMAQDLSVLHGQWAGEGAIQRGDEPAERFQCRITLREIDAAQTFMTGRCATAQASRSFQYMLIDGGNGSVRAENRAPVEDDLPAAMQGRLAADGVRIADGDAALFELRRSGAEMLFRIEGEENGQHAVGTVVMAPRG
ncbi:MAG: hypothetical protein Kow0013_24410 [Pararhodobacter sp.]